MPASGGDTHAYLSLRQPCSLLAGHMPHKPGDPLAGFDFARLAPYLPALAEGNGKDVSAIMPSSPWLRPYRIMRPSLVLSQSFTDRLWCGQNEKWWIMGRSRDQFGPEGPEVSTPAACRSPAVRTWLKADGLLAIRT